MSILFSSDFEAATTGALPAGWTAHVGTWAATTSNPPAGSKSLGTSTAADGDLVRLSSIAAQGFTQWQIDYKNLGASQAYTPIARLSADGQNFYLFQATPSAPGSGYDLQLYRIAGAAQAQIGTGVSHALSGNAAGDIVHTEILCNGSTIEGRIWINGTARPASPSVTATDSTFATGQVGARYTQASTIGLSGFDSALLQDASVASLTVSGTAPNGTVGGAFSVAYTASGGTAPYTYSVGSGALPPGTSLNPSTGVVSGTLTTAGTSNFVIHAVDSTP